MSYNDFSSNPNHFGTQSGLRRSGSSSRSHSVMLSILRLPCFVDDQWNNDPTSTSTTTSDRQFAGTDTGSGVGVQSNKWDPSEGGDWNNQQSGLRDQYRDSGNTTDFTTPGTGGSFASPGRDADQQFEARRPMNTNNWTSETGATDGDHFVERPSSGEHHERTSAGAKKPSIGDKLKGEVIIVPPFIWLAELKFTLQGPWRRSPVK